MTRVFLHVRSASDYRGQNMPRDFARIPIVGEYVATAIDSPWYRVLLVVHAPFPSEYEAEVYAVEVDSQAVLRDEWLPAQAGEAEPTGYATSSSYLGRGRG